MSGDIDEYRIETIRKLTAEKADLLAALKALTVVCGSTGNGLEDFEEQAEAFRIETGYFRPGKDIPAAMAGDDRHDDFDGRRMKYAAWVQSKIDAARSAIAKARGAHSGEGRT